MNKNLEKYTTWIIFLLLVAFLVVGFLGSSTEVKLNKCIHEKNECIKEMLNGCVIRSATPNDNGGDYHFNLSD